MFYAPILDEPEILVDLAWNIPPLKQNNIPNRQKKKDYQSGHTLCCCLVINQLMEHLFSLDQNSIRTYT